MSGNGYSLIETMAMSAFITKNTLTLRSPNGTAIVYGEDFQRLKQALIEGEQYEMD
ncbi:hypothetical protein [Aminobacterium colombiense]|uniref:Uncharacterized protein n=1 Tax=Aminobacterium colombiense (strain DSM 12261 / ALA-1) TaxID=572547 RepID=D5EEU4_AMICL|nr:hypothetical protein [Aminobacterium colombiense]ADE57076.1 hypothetical protein Amico_0951 [Aminobacterium colombiense DSM 12261]